VNKQHKRILYSTVDLHCLISILAPGSSAYGMVIATTIVQSSVCELVSSSLMFTNLLLNHDFGTYKTGNFLKKFVTKWTSKVGKYYIRYARELYTRETLTLFLWAFWRDFENQTSYAGNLLSGNFLSGKHCIYFNPGNTYCNLSSNI
jgi:hypothetical protein